MAPAISITNNDKQHLQHINIMSCQQVVLRVELEKVQNWEKYETEIYYKTGTE